MRKLISALFLAELVSLTNAFQLQLATVSPAGDEDEVTEVVEKVDAGETVPIVDEEVIEYAEEEGVDTEAEKEEYSEVTTVCVTADGEEYNSEECDCDPEQPDSGV